MKFQALGSHYSCGWSLRQLVAYGNNNHKAALLHELSSRYDGLPYLYAKGRHALSEAMRIAVHAQPDRPGVVINGLTCSVVVDAVLAAEATLVFADIAPPSLDFSADTLDMLCRNDPTIGTVVVQNTFGVPVDIAAIEAVARQHQLIVIEDVAHAVGQRYADGREVGTVGDMTMLSFGRDKLLDVVNGGALIVRTEQLRRHADEPTRLPRSIDQFRDRIYPMLTWFVRRTFSIGLGKAIMVTMYRSRLAIRSSDGTVDRRLTLPNWQIALVLKRLATIDILNDQRRSRMDTYERYLGDELLSSGGTLRATIRRTDRTALLRRFKKAGFELADTWYDAPIGPKRKFRSYNYPTADCPQAVEAASQLINLPTHREITEDDAIRLAEIVRQS